MTEELARYSRQISLPQVGLKGQQRLREAKVLCVGAGGLGSPLLLYLAAAGVGTLGIVDNDIVDFSNLHRQILYTEGDVHSKKVRVAKERLNALNPAVQVIPHEERLTKNNALSLIRQYDIIADGSDNFATRYLVNDACFYAEKPNVYASIFQFEGQCSVFTSANGPCYRCLYDSPPPPNLMPNCAEGGVLGVLPGLLGTLQATEVLKLILGIGDSLIGRLLTIDVLKLQFREFSLPRNPECRLCIYRQPFETLVQDVQACAPFPKGGREDFELGISLAEFRQLQKQRADFVLLDVREPYEYAAANLGGYLIPLGELPQRLGELDQSKLIIVHCQAGPRSQRAAVLLHEAGFSEVKYLVGGMN